MKEYGNKQNSSLLSGRLLAKNTVFNLLGQGAPLLVAVFAVPVLVKQLGTDRFGILTLAWALIGYFGLFDLGLGRALTKLTAEKLGKGQNNQIPQLARTGIALMVALGLVGLIVLSLTTPWLVQDVLKIPSLLRTEARDAFYILAFSLPFVITTAGMRGILEAYQRFDLINAVRIPMGVFTFLGPLAVLPFSKAIPGIVGVLALGRIIAMIVHFWLCLHVLPDLRKKFSLTRAEIRPLLTFGAWMTVSNVVGPVMVYFDRFLIAALISVAAVAYYSTPYEIVTKLWIIPGALVGVLFPAFATSSYSDPTHTGTLFCRGVKYLFLAMFPITLMIVAFAHDGLTLWLGSDFARNGTRVAQWLSIGVFVNCLAQIPFSLIQGVGRPDFTAKLHLLELPLYVYAVWCLTKNFGIEGAAIAWVARVSIDAVLLFWFAHRFLRTNVSAARWAVIVFGLALAVLIIASTPSA